MLVFCAHPTSSFEFLFVNTLGDGGVITINAAFFSENQHTFCYPQQEQCLYTQHSLHFMECGLDNSVAHLRSKSDEGDV